MITESIITATRIVWPELSVIGWPGGSPRPPTIGLGGSDEACGSGSVGPSIVLDFGEEVYGGIRLDIVELPGVGSCTLRVRLGESVSEAVTGSFVDREECVRSGSRLDVGVTGFRFARVDLVDDDPSARVAISIPVAYRLARDAPRLGSFSCDDARLDRIWEVGARTVHLCMQDLIWDGIKRGRTVWAGDLHPASNAIAATFGPHPIVPASLDQLRRRTTDERGDVSGWMNDIPAYSLWWIICQAEWFLLAGDRAYLAGQAEYLARLLTAIVDGIDADGREQFEGWRYLDWATTRDFDAIEVGYHGLTAWALRSARVLFEALGDVGMHALCGAALARLESHRPPATGSKQAHALMVLGGLSDAGSTNRDHLAADPARGLTPFLGYHVLEARALAGDHAGALALVRDYWGAMIDLGATTFWEDFDINWVAASGMIDAIVPDGLRDIHAGLGRNAGRGMSLSLCHGWSAGPTAWLSRHVLGVRPIEAGCRIVGIRPELGDLSRAEGSFPTPLGVIQVRHRRRADGSIETEVEAPDSIEVVVGE